MSNEHHPMAVYATLKGCQFGRVNPPSSVYATLKGCQFGLVNPPSSVYATLKGCQFGLVNPPSSGEVEYLLRSGWYRLLPPSDTGHGLHYDRRMWITMPVGAPSTYHAVPVVDVPVEILDALTPELIDSIS